MNVLEINEIGKFIRKTRKERGLRLEDLSDEQISTATISNIERGVPHVNKEKVIYLMGKLGLDVNDIPQLMEKDSESMESVQLKFIAIETMIKLGNVQHALATLSKISEDSLSQHEATTHLLKGRCYILTKEWKKAERELAEAIRLASQDSYAVKSNLEATGYHSLAYCRFIQNDWEQSLKFVEKGLDSYQECSNNYDQILYTLMTHRVICLEKLGRTDEALKYLDDLWSQIPYIQNKDVLLNMYALRADLFRRMKLYHDAVRYAKEGIQLAVHSKNPDEMFKLWTILGSVYMELSQLDDAETCFEFVLDLSDQVSNQHDVARTYGALGQLYLLQEKWDQARSTLKLALELAEKLNDTVQYNHALMVMGKLMKKMNRLVEAVQYFQQAVQLAERYGFTQKVFQGYYELAHCYEQLKYTQEFKQATERMYVAQRQIQKEGQLFWF